MLNLTITFMKNIAIKKSIPIKKIVLILVIFVWVGFSIWYIANDQWQDFQNTKMQAAYQKGFSDSVKTLMNESTKCQPIPLFNGDKRVEMISIECLQKANEQAQQGEQK